jgi:integrase
LDGTSLRVRRSLIRLPGKNWSLAQTKTGKNRAVPLPTIALEALEGLRQSLPPELRQPESFVFSTAEGQPLDCQNVVNRHFKPLLKRASLPPLRLYDLRHSCATLLFAQGVPAKVVQERLGHSDIGLTLNTYTHVLPGMQEEAAEKLNTMLTAPRKLKLA